MAIEASSLIDGRKELFRSSHGRWVSDEEQEETAVEFAGEGMERWRIGE